MKKAALKLFKMAILQKNYTSFYHEHGFRTQNHGMVKTKLFGEK